MGAVWFKLVGNLGSYADVKLGLLVSTLPKNFLKFQTKHGLKVEKTKPKSKVDLKAESPKKVWMNVFSPIQRMAILMTTCAEQRKFWWLTLWKMGTRKPCSAGCTVYTTGVLCVSQPLVNVLNGSDKLFSKKISFEFGSLKTLTDGWDLPYRALCRIPSRSSSHIWAYGRANWNCESSFLPVTCIVSKGRV